MEGSGLPARQAPIELDADEFRRLGHGVVDAVADFLRTLPERPVAPGESLDDVRDALGRGGLPEEGVPADTLLAEAGRLPRALDAQRAPALLRLHHLLGRPDRRARRPARRSRQPEPRRVAALAACHRARGPDGALDRGAARLPDRLRRAAGQRRQHGELRRLPRRAPGPRAVERALGRHGCVRGRPLRVYGSAETHTWIEKAADLFGLGTDAIRWVETDGEQRLLVPALRELIAKDRAKGSTPFLVVGTAGSVSTGAIDPLDEIAALCREEGIWFHVDGAYGAPAAALPDAPPELKALAQADSVAIDPHKWLYTPLEAGCALVRDPRTLLDAFTYRPPYYTLPEGEDAPISYVDYGPQNSRGFRALKVWLGLRQVGRAGYVRMISDDIALAAELHGLAAADPELEAWTTSLSITTFRYVPTDVEPGSPATEEYLNALNRELLVRLQDEGEAFVSNAVVGDTYLFRACIVNFRTSRADVQALPEVVKRTGAAIHGARESLPSA